jgi:hypothetical protein
MEHSANKKGKLAVGIVVTCALVVAGYTSLRDYSFRPRQFDSSEWKQGPLRLRGEMVASLQQQTLLVGKSRDEVLTLLGKPDEDFGHQLRYSVDVGRRIAWEMFPEKLIVELDERSHVDRVLRVD